MVFSGSCEGNKSNASLEASDKKSNKSKTSVKSLKIGDEDGNNQRPKSSSSTYTRKNMNVRGRSKTVEGNDDLIEKNKSSIPELDLLRKYKKEPPDKYEKQQSDMNFRNKAYKTLSSCEKNSSTQERKTHGAGDKYLDFPEKRTNKDCKILDSFAQKSWHNSTGMAKNWAHKKPSEIPKLKLFLKPNQETSSKSSKLSMKSNGMETNTNGTTRTRHEIPQKSIHARKEMKETKDKKADEHVREAMAEDYTPILSVCRNELKQLTDVWINTIYCSMSIRANLVQLLFEAFPNISNDQFELENEKILNHFANAKVLSLSETESLIDFIKSVVENREKVKEQYDNFSAKEEVAEAFNHDWRKMSRKISDIGVKTKLFQNEVPELQRQKEANDLSQQKKIRNMEISFATKDEQLKKLENQFTILKQREASFAKNNLCKIQDFKDIKEDVSYLKSMEKEFGNLKKKFKYQNETCEKKIKDLETLLEEKTKILETEKEVKQQQQKYLKYLQEEQKTTGSSIRVISNEDRNKKRNQLCVAAVKLLLKGFVIQMKKLERDRNKMLLELQSNDYENFEAIANSIIKKDNFIKSIKYQMSDFQKAGKFSTGKTS